MHLHRLFFLALFFICCEGFSQKSTDSLCSYQSPYETKAKAIVVTIFVPCTWEQRVSARESIVQSFVFKKDQFNLNASLSIMKLPGKVSPEDLDDMFSDKSLRKMAPSAFTDVSTSKLVIDGRKSGEIIGSYSSERNGQKVYTTMAMYFIYIGNIQVVTSFGTSGMDEKLVKEEFYTHKEFLQDLVQKIEIRD